MNFALEELRQVDFSRYNKKSKAPLLLFSCSSLFQWRGNHPSFHFQHSALQTSEFRFALSKSFGILLSLFLSTQPGKHRNSLLFFAFCLISTMNFEKAISYFSTPNPAFSQNYVHRIELTFF
jgi:hypothetical protein